MSFLNKTILAKLLKLETSVCRYKSLLHKKIKDKQRNKSKAQEQCCYHVHLWNLLYLKKIPLLKKKETQLTHPEGSSEGDEYCSSFENSAGVGKGVVLSHHRL